MEDGVDEMHTIIKGSNNFFIQILIELQIQLHVNMKYM